MRKDIAENYSWKSEYWMSTEYDDWVLQYCRLPNKWYMVKMKQDEAGKSESDLKNTMPTHLGSFIVSDTKRVMNNFKQ